MFGADIEVWLFKFVWRSQKIGASLGTFLSTECTVSERLLIHLLLIMFFFDLISFLFRNDMCCLTDDQCLSNV
jgi:hypothetical protein